MKIFFIRHGESVANKEKVFQGWTDVSLSEKGQEQAKSLGEYFKRNNTQFTKIYSSSLKRAVETGQFLIQNSVFPELVTCKDFRSINVGLWAGITIDEIKERFSAEFEKWKTEPQKFCFPEGESIIDVQKRAKSTLFEILKEHHNLQQNIGIVTHMITIKVLILTLLNLDLTSIWEPQYTIPNTGMFIFEVKRTSGDDVFKFKKIPTETSIPHLD